MSSNQNEIRKKVIDKYICELDFSENIVVNIEIGIFNYTIDYCKNLNIPLNWESDIFQSIYINKSISIYSLLKQDSYIENKSLIERINNNLIQPHLIASLSNEELFPEKWYDLLTKHQDKVKNAYEMNMVPMSDTIVCKKCKSRKITYVEVQTRASDEASTTMCTCLDCGCKWKF